MLTDLINRMIVAIIGSFVALAALGALHGTDSLKVGRVPVCELTCCPLVGCCRTPGLWTPMHTQPLPTNAFALLHTPLCHLERSSSLRVLALTLHASSIDAPGVHASPGHHGPGMHDGLVGNACTHRELISVRAVHPSFCKCRRR